MELLDLFKEIGGYAGLLSVLGLAVLSLLYFAQAREVKRLREWAGRAPERAAELEERIAAQATAARTPPPPPPAPAPAAAPGTPATATAAAAGAAPATAAARAAAPPSAAGGGDGGGEGDEEERTQVATPATAASAAAPAAAPAHPGTGGGSPPATSGPAPTVPTTPGAGMPPSPPSPPAGNGTAAPPARPPAAPSTPAARRPPVPATRRPVPTATVAPRDGSAEDGGGSRRKVVAAVVASVLVVLGAGAVLATQLGGGDPSPAPNRVEAPQASDGAGGGDPDGPTSRGDVTVAVLNGTTVNGLAAQLADRLQASGYEIPDGLVKTASDQQRSATTISYAAGRRRQALEVAQVLGICESTASCDAVIPLDRSTQVQATEDAEVVVTVGADRTQ